MTFSEQNSQRVTLIRLGGLMLLLVLLNGLFGLAAIHYTHDVCKAALERAQDDTRAAQIHFKIQVQEWKNVLLRGHVPQDLERYQAAFNNQYDQVAARLDGLRRQAEGTGLSEAEIGALIDQHAAMQQSYETALARFIADGGQTPRDIDQQVRGIDRDLADRIDGLAEAVGTKTRALRDEVDRAVQERYTLVFNYSLAANLIIAALVFLLLAKALWSKQRS